ncbi:MAG: alpha-2-macroglobulin [Treponema sp.]|jgi:uncharacterized protein YfaS (alpha-2-macroglobulin family)|nr:alpha-2-macroglobulin [Treponema sp.]
MSVRRRFPEGLLVLCFAVSLFAAGACKEQNAGVSPPATVFSGSLTAPGRAAAGLDAYRIAYYEAETGGAEGMAAGSIAESNEPFTVVDYGPRGELPAEVKKPSIYVVFSQPVTPLAKLGEPLRWEEGTPGPGLFTVDPPLPGVFRWYGTRLLAFESDAVSLPQRQYTVTVSERIRSLGGKTLEGERSFSFETERLSVLHWQLGDGEIYVRNWDAPPEDAKNIIFIFSYPVNLDEIRRWIRVSLRNRNRASAELPFRVSRPGKMDNDLYDRDQGVLLILEEKLPPDTDVDITVLRGARSEDGWLGTKTDNVFSFHTLLPFDLDNVSARSESSPRTEQGDSIPVILDFSHGIDPESAAGAFSVEGFPALTAENVHVYGSTVILNRLPLEYRKAYTVKIGAALRDLWGRRLGEDKTATVKTGEAASYVFIGNQGSQMLEAGFTPGVIWEAQNPVSLRRVIQAAAGPYERPPLSALQAVDVNALPRNSKQYFMEDLSPFLGPSGKGSARMRWDYEIRSRWEPGRVYRNNVWLTVQVTNIGLTVRYAYNRVLVWAVRLSSGEPVAGARVTLMEGTSPVREGVTDGQGLAFFDFPGGAFVSRFTRPSTPADTGRNETQEAVGQGLRIRVTEGGGARAGGDEVEFIPNDSHNLWRSRIEATVSPFEAEKERPVIFLFTDRGIYRPGETVTFRGIDRELRLGQYRVYEGPYSITVKSDAFRAPAIASLAGTTTPNGGSHGSFALPESLDPGRYTIVYKRGEAEASVTFTVANFERLRMEASLDFPEAAFFPGEQISARLSASYLAGGVLAGAPYSWYWTRESAAFNPGGAWRYWKFGPEQSDGRSFIAQGEGNLGPDGSAVISQEPRPDGVEGSPYRYRLEASVQDAARQAVAVTDAVIVHPADFYIAARLDPGTPRSLSEVPASSPSSYLLPEGSPAALSWSLLTPGGLSYADPGTGAAQAPLIIQFVRYEWKQARQAGIGGRVNLLWERVEEIAEERTIDITVPRGNNSGTVAFTPDKAGQWEMRLRRLDSRGRTAATRFGFYVSGAGWVRWGIGDVDSITMTPDRTVYAPGDTAKLLVRSPLPKGKYLLTLEREGIISEKILELDGAARTIDIPIEESFTPVVYAALSSFTVRRGLPENSYYLPDLDKPKGVFGIVALPVDSANQHYVVEIEPVKEVYGPGEKAEVRIRVTVNGKPAPNTEVSFMAVDRGVVDLINYHVPDPLAFFYDPRHFPLGVRGADSRSLLIDPVTYSLSDLQGGDNEDDSKLDERKDFRPTAVFEPYLVTGKDGIATVKFSLPDSLTTYRCTALAVGLAKFGVVEEDLRVSAPLTAVAALPRKLRWRDTGTVSLILTNLEKEAVEAVVSLAVDGVTEKENGDPSDINSNTVDSGNNTDFWDAALEVDGESSKTVRIPPGAAAEVSFKVAAVGAGRARLVFTLRSPKVNERIIRSLSVDRPVLYETVTAAGNLREGIGFAEEGIVLPSLVPLGTGSLSVSISASRMALLREAVGYLLDYPYGCLEQRTAALLPLVSFGDRLDAFGLESPVTNPRQVIEEELVQIAKNKLPDGSYPYWPGGQYGNIMVTLRVAHIAALARAKGYAVPSSLDVSAALTFTVASGEARRLLPQDPFLQGYSLWIRAMYGEQVGNEIAAFTGQGDKIGISGFAFAGLASLELGQKAAALAARDRIRNFIRPGTQTLDLTDTYEQRGNFWGYDTDRYALALMLYHALNPGDDMTSRLAASLVERQRRGIWSNTSSSFWAVLAFGRIADAEAASKPDVSVSISLGPASLLTGEFRSYGGVPLSRTFPFAAPPLDGLDRDVPLPLHIERNGTGQLFYTANLRYGVPAELASPRDEGISVFAETLDDDSNPVKDGRLIPGRTYTRRVLASTSRDRTFLVLRVPVPSGAEIIDAALVTSPAVPLPEDQTEDSDWRFRNSPPVRFVMDDEVRFHWDFFPAGRQELRFRFRAVMPGVYPTPPAQAECMYEEEVFGRSAGELIRIGG